MYSAKKLKAQLGSHSGTTVFCLHTLQKVQSCTPVQLLPIHGKHEPGIILELILNTLVNVTESRDYSLIVFGDISQLQLFKLIFVI